MNGRAIGQPSKGGRRGAVFSVRVTEEERAALQRLQEQRGGPRSLGPWLVWRALEGEPGDRAGTTGSSLPTVSTRYYREDKRIILDLCAGSGSWSEPYASAGYRVVRVTLPELDVRTFRPPANVWGVLAAPPCTEFSLAKNGQEGPDDRDFVEGMACVNACMRIVAQCRPAWWALENPTGYLSRFLGTPRDVFQPCDFGDPWTKRTALWGDFALPRRGPFVEPEGSAMDRSTAADRAVTPPGFARAFFEANP